MEHIHVQPLDVDGVNCLRRDMGASLWLHWCGGCDGEIQAHLQRSWSRGIWWLGVIVDDVHVGLISLRNRVSHYEIAWMIVEEHRQKGYATGAVDIVLSEFAPSLLLPIQATINEDNRASIRVAQAHGFQPVNRDRRTIRYRLETPLSS